MYGYAIISAQGCGTEEAPSHSIVKNCAPNGIQKLFNKTESPQRNDDGEWDIYSETKWEVICETQEQWELLRDYLDLDPEKSCQTGGIMTVLDDGPTNLPALSRDLNGMDWNVGVATPVSFVNVYYLAWDEDICEELGIDREAAIAAGAQP